jgi:hypothetical protein
MPEPIAYTNGDDNEGELMCMGCSFRNGHETMRSPGCAAIKEALDGDWCGSTIWIPDTPEGLAEYIALKLEAS